MFPNNRTLAERRLTNLERSLDKDSEGAKALYDTVESYIAKDYARKLSPTEIATKKPNLVSATPCCDKPQQAGKDSRSV